MSAAPPSLEHNFPSDLNEQKQMLIDALLDGRAKDYAEYKYMVGQIRGLTVATNRFGEYMKLLRDE